MPRRLIVNADGFGFTYGNNRGILECFPAGVIKSVSVNANFPAVEESPRLPAEFPDVSVGVHLNLTVGPCVSDPKTIPDLVNEEGEFLGAVFVRKALVGGIPRDQIVRELTAQVERLQGYGIRLTHWDGHQNKHLLPPFFGAALEVARRFGIERMRTHVHHLFTVRGARRMRVVAHYASHPWRGVHNTMKWLLMRKARKAGMRMADRLITPSLLDGTRKFHREFWSELFHRLPGGTSEVYCHPGYPDETLRQHADYVDERLGELELLRDPALAEEAVRCGVELISFREI